MKKISEKIWDLWCIISIIGIWPRFIEPNLLITHFLKIKIKNLPEDLKNFKILHFSDLHFQLNFPDSFLKKLTKKINALEPDLILFTGDFICYATMQDEVRLHSFLSSLKAKHGCYSILGNHDYAEFISINEQGDYDVLNKEPSAILRGFKRLFKKITLTGKPTERALKVKENNELTELIKRTPFKLLHNETVLLPVGSTYLNICGLGEYMLGKCLPKKAFEGYNTNYPGIVLAHNPDSISLLKNFPGDIILSGHTHGGQINLPWIWKKFALLENTALVKGLKKVGNKYIYISKGIAGVLPFRWFCLPEIVLLTLESEK